MQKTVFQLFPKHADSVPELENIRGVGAMEGNHLKTLERKSAGFAFSPNIRALLAPNMPTSSFFQPVIIGLVPALAHTRTRCWN